MTDNLSELLQRVLNPLNSTQRHKNPPRPTPGETLGLVGSDLAPANKGQVRAIVSC